MRWLEQARGVDVLKMDDKAKDGETWQDGRMKTEKG